MNRPIPPRPPHGGWHDGRWNGWYDDWHRGWHRGRWTVNVWPPIWVTGGFSAGWMWGGNTFVYNNPFYIAPTTTTTTTIVEVPVAVDYSQPLPAPTEEWVDEPWTDDEWTDDDERAAADPEMEQAIELFDQAREAFKASDYQRALELVDQAIELLPSDTTLHEFRALCLFAIKEYQQAAAAIYAVLAAGPGWNWDTLASLYQDLATHTTQLRNLEAFVQAHPDDAAATFLLAYHYMTMGHFDEAVDMLERVARLLPDDPLVGQLLEAFRQNPSAENGPQ